MPKFVTTIDIVHEAPTINQAISNAHGIASLIGQWVPEADEAILGETEDGELAEGGFYPAYPRSES